MVNKDKTKVIDLSVMIENSPSEPMEVKIERLDHKRGARKMAWKSHFKPGDSLVRKLITALTLIFGKRKVTKADFPDEEFITLDTVTMPTHMGTHVDAPLHFGSTSEGRAARTIEQIPLEHFYGSGVRIDLRHKGAGKFITVADIEAGLRKINHTLSPGEIVLLWTGTDKKWGSRDYFFSAPGMSREATAYLVEQKIKLIGIDTYGFDRPFGVMLKEFTMTGDNSVLWPAHFYGREQEYLHIERLANLEALPDKGFKVCCFPLKLKGGDASWVRAVAIVD